MSFLVERDVMAAAYAVRELNQARRISNELAAETVSAHEHLLVGRPVDIWNRHEFYEHYDTENPQQVELSLASIFHWWSDDGRTVGCPLVCC